MVDRVVRVGWLLCCASVATGCVSGGDDQADPDGTVILPEISVTVPPARLTPFCQAMIDLRDRLTRGDVEDAESVIITTYREVLDDVPPVIATDFDAVLDALERGDPPPTDPPAPSTTSTTSTTSTAPAPVDSSVVTAAPSLGSVDEGFDPSTSPAGRINDYVAFTCRNTENNPGPPPTQPLTEVAPTDG